MVSSLRGLNLSDILIIKNWINYAFIIGDDSYKKLYSKNFPRYQGTRSQLAVEEYYKVAKKHGISLTQMSLAFVNMQPFVDSNIIGATKLDQLEENINSVHIELSDEMIADINAIHENNPSPAP